MAPYTVYNSDRDTTIEADSLLHAVLLKLGAKAIWPGEVIVIVDADGYIVGTKEQLQVVPEMPRYA